MHIFRINRAWVCIGLAFYTVLLITILRYRGVEVHRGCRSASSKRWTFIGITSEKNSQQALTTMETWGSQVAILWFGEGSLPSSLKAIEVTHPIYLQEYQKGNGYKYMAYKLQWIWQYVYEHVHKSSPSDWYIFFKQFSSRISNVLLGISDIGKITMYLSKHFGSRSCSTMRVIRYCLRDGPMLAQATMPFQMEEVHGF